MLFHTDLLFQCVGGFYFCWSDLNGAELTRSLPWRLINRTGLYAGRISLCLLELPAKHRPQRGECLIDFVGVCAFPANTHMLIQSSRGTGSGGFGPAFNKYYQ